MAQKFCSFFCCSCCTSPSPNSPPQSSQQQQQTITAHSSSSSSSACCGLFSPSPAQSSEPTPTMADFKNFLQKFNDISQIETLIPLLENLLKIASGEKSDYGGSNSTAASFIPDGQRMLEMLEVDKRIGKRPVKNNSGDGTVEEIGKVCIEVLKGSEKIPQVGIALCMLGSVLERFSHISQNRNECLGVLKRMVDLAKQIVELSEQIPEQKEKLDEGIQCIIEGTIMCISKLASPTIFSFLTATVNKESLNAFHRKVDRLIMDIQFATVIRIGKRVIDSVPKIASESQKSYGYQSTVGIEGAQERVIELLDLNAQDTKSVVVVVHGFGGIGKTTLADAVYAQLNLQSYKYCRVHMEQDSSKNDLKGLQQQILYGLFAQNINLKDCDQGQGKLYSFFKKNPDDQPLFLYIGLKNTDLEQLLPKDLDSCLPPKSRILITTRNLDETDIFVGINIVCRHYDVNPLVETEARKLLLKKVPEYNDEDNIVNLLKLCGGVPLLLELAGSQLAINKGKSRKNIALEMLNEGEQVKESDRMVGFVYDRLLPPVQRAFLDITASFYYNWDSKYVSSIVGEEEFRGLKAASFVKTSEYGWVIVHDIVKARGKRLADQEGNRIRDVNTLSECLKDEEKLKKLRGIYLDEEYEEPAIEINCHHLNCMSDSLRVLSYNGSHITFREKCQKPFQQLRCLAIGDDVRDLPMPMFEKLEHLVYYFGPLTQGMNLYEFPPSLRFMTLTNYSENRVEYSKVPPKVTTPSSLVELRLFDFKNMQRLPDGVEKLTKLETLAVWDCNELRELPSKLTDLSNLRELTLFRCNELKELPSNFGQLTKLERLSLCCCDELRELPSKLTDLSNLRELKLFHCTKLKELPPNFGQLKTLEKLDLSDCSGLVELPSDFGQLQNLKKLDLSFCSNLKEWPLSFRDLTQIKEINLRGCLSELCLNIKRNNCKIVQ